MSQKAYLKIEEGDTLVVALQKMDAGTEVTIDGRVVTLQEQKRGAL